MKLPCKVIEDMLPMYYDGLCSDETGELVAEHLRDCPECRRMMEDLSSEVELPAQPVDDLKPLADIQAQWKKEKRRSMGKGIRATLAVLLAVLALWTAIWYFGYAIHYDRLAGKMEQITGETAAMTTASHYAIYDDYPVILKKPGFLGEGGFVHVAYTTGHYIYLDDDWKQIGQNSDTYIDLFFYPKFGGGYEAAVMIEKQDGTVWAWLTPELGLDLERHGADNLNKGQIDDLEYLLKHHHKQITDLVETAERFFEIDLFAEE